MPPWRLPLLPYQGTGEDEDVESSSLNLMETEDGFQPVFFDPRPLKNLLLIDETSSLMPITDMKVGRARAGREVGEKGRLNQEQSELELIERTGWGI
jgi:hypothetical protein